MNRFGQCCLLARRLIEAGVRFVTVNMFETVFDEITWDIHGSKPFSPISCYRDLVGPMFDKAYSARCSKICTSAACSRTRWSWRSGEFGRTPKVNPAGGRDHWPQCWTMLMGGGGIKGGQVVGASDEIGGAPKDRPTTPASRGDDLSGLGIDSNRNCPGRRAARFRWSIAASSRSRNCSCEAAMRRFCMLVRCSLAAAHSARRISPFCRASVELTGPEARQQLLAEAALDGSSGRLDAQGAVDVVRIRRSRPWTPTAW